MSIEFIVNLFIYYLEKMKIVIKKCEEAWFKKITKEVLYTYICCPSGRSRCNHTNILAVSYVSAALVSKHKVMAITFAFLFC